MTSREVKCLICGEVCQGRLTYHLKKIHNLTTRDYKDKVNAAVDFCKTNGLVYCYVNRFSGISKN